MPFLIPVIQSDILTDYQNEKKEKNERKKKTHAHIHKSTSIYTTLHDNIGLYMILFSYSFHIE